MKILLAGHEGSKKIVPASAYLVKKYLPGFDVYFLNYGLIWFELLCATYISLDKTQEGDADAWARYIANYLKGIDDDFVIFGLDDYLVAGDIDIVSYNKLYDRMTTDENIVCARLCTSDFYRDVKDIGDGIIMLGDVEYSATTQYCIWRKKYLVELLEQVTTPWDFEIQGSRILNASGKKVIGVKQPVIQYLDCSALSPKWGDKIKVRGIKDEDIQELIDKGLVERNCLIS